VKMLERKRVLGGKARLMVRKDACFILGLFAPMRMGNAFSLVREKLMHV
jgi:hypothetical protein